ncbi:hypothetical protein OCK74_19970 [Chitinophagaceae bacterium LB-8]|uniref:Phosphodiester glycosidase domain-containing protein n=1 Tax=Paraflavisolibacter caeni TaxID=2982496 RepID=A0A9X2XYX7_9BACT|nr:hypothetical protein [Paraflavisolibacter caeni]MCU7551410.1 hypothetical protein [Paraflavisolibacter caeni]
MKISKLLLAAISQIMFVSAMAQYDASLVEYKSSSIAGETYSVIKMSRKGERVKVKYFAANAPDGSLVYERYQKWASNKNVIAVSSGTYMTDCNARKALPVGFCVDNGTIVNRQEKNGLDGLAVVYATGGIVASNIKDGNLSVKIDGQNATLDIRNAFDRERFLKWAQGESATVFQTHLFVYKNQLKLGTNSSPNLASRRFLAVCKDEDGYVVHYIINLPKEATIYQGSDKAFKILKDAEYVQDVVFMINLDTGCQNVFSLFDSKGNKVANKNFAGDTDITNASNLIVYYYE